MSWFYYLLEANLYLTLFYIGYCLVLNKETYYSLNRAYLLITSMLAFVLPFMQLGILKHPTSLLQQQITAINFNMVPVGAKIEAAPTPALTMDDYILCLYIAGAAVLFFVFLFKLYRLLKLTDGRTAAGQYQLVRLNNSDTAFSFFNYMFIGSNIPAADTIIRHELVHIRQKHSADIIFIELLKIVNWFNPFIYLLQISLKAVHEYIADEQTASDASAYSTFLVNNAYGLSGSSITHSFFNYNLLKKRIIMLHQKRSGSLARLKYLMAVPLCAALLCASTLAFSKTYGFIDLAPDKAIARQTPPPPPPAPPVNAKMHFSPPHNSNTSLTSKNVRVQEYQYMIGNKIDFSVAILKNNIAVASYFKSQANDATIKFLSDKFGYTFPANGKFELAHPGYDTPLPAHAVRLVLPRRIPADPAAVSAPSPTVKMVVFPPPIVKMDKKAALAPPPPPVPPVKEPKVVHETPPPPPGAPEETQVVFPEPKNPSMVTSKGYKYAEASYKINGKTDYKVIIVEKDGTKKEWFKNSASAADVKLLKEKYGFTFMPIHQYEKMLPPPPPPAAPKSVKVVRFPPPVVVPDGRVAPKSVRVVRFPPPVVVPDSPNNAKHVKMVRLLPPQKPLQTIRLLPPASKNDSLTNKN